MKTLDLDFTTKKRKNKSASETQHEEQNTLPVAQQAESIVLISPNETETTVQAETVQTTVQAETVQTTVQVSEKAKKILERLEAEKQAGFDSLNTCETITDTTTANNVYFEALQYAKQKAGCICRLSDASRRRILSGVISDTTKLLEADTVFCTLIEMRGCICGIDNVEQEQQAVFEAYEDVQRQKEHYKQQQAENVFLVTIDVLEAKILELELRAKNVSSFDVPIINAVVSRTKEKLRVKNTHEERRTLYEIAERVLLSCPVVELDTAVVQADTVVVHKSKSKFDVYIGRPSKWGNPFSHIKSETLAKYQVDSREEAINKYRTWITQGEGKHLLNDLHELEGKILGCWCSPKPCHGDVLVELIQERKAKQ